MSIFNPPPANLPIPERAAQLAWIICTNGETRLKQGESDRKQIAKLADELSHRLCVFPDTRTDDLRFRKREVDGQLTVDIIHYPNGEDRASFILATCWIEFNSTPQSFFYWES